jgi:hypothetical protein
MSAFAASDDPDAQDYSFAEDDPAITTPPIPQDQNLSSGAEGSHGRSHSNNPLLGNENPLVSELEQEVLDEYSRLLRNVNQVGKPGIFSFSFLVGMFFFLSRNQGTSTLSQANSVVSRLALRESLRSCRLPSFHDS